MKFSGPGPLNPIDENRNGQIGASLDRVDGVLKVTGGARYAYEYEAPTPAAYAALVTATIAKGRIRSIDTQAAARAPGVLHVMSHHNAPAQADPNARLENGLFGAMTPLVQFADDRVRHFGQIIGVVVAETLEAAQAVARLVHVEYDAEPGAFNFERAREGADIPPPGFMRPTSVVGDFDASYPNCAVQVDETYTTPIHTHVALEAHAALAIWDDESLTVYCSTQNVKSAQKMLALTLQLPPENVRVLSRYVGGGFGGKMNGPELVLAALCARAVGRPVKLAMTRPEVFHATHHRSATHQHLRLGASKDGVLDAIGFESYSHAPATSNFFEANGNAAASLYQAPNRKTTHYLARLDLPAPGAVRAPGEAAGLLAMECAMDELAHRTGLDPVELRLRNEPKVDPTTGAPFSTRQLVACVQDGARRFGWGERKQPGARREGDWLVGLGMACAVRGNFMLPAKCKAHLGGDGVFTIRMAMTDIGTGSYTILTQVAAEMLGIDPHKIVVQLGDSDFPETAGSGGSFGATSTTSALYDCCVNARKHLAEAAGFDPDTAIFADGKVSDSNRSEYLTKLAGNQGLDFEGEIAPDWAAFGKISQHGYGAVFAEVGVNTLTAETRVRRMLGVFAAGRILNAKTARSQALGGMIWGVGAALTEGALVNQSYGDIAAHDLSEYQIPTHADIPAIDAIFLPEVDRQANPLGAKGVGELSNGAAGAAVANAVFNATGARIRDFPLTIERLLPALAS